MSLIEDLRTIVGEEHVLTGADAKRFGEGWVSKYHFTPGAVVRPGSTEEVSRILALADANDTAIVPVSGNTGLTGATHAEGGIMLSVERLNRIREIRPDARIAIVEAGTILSNIHDAVEEHELVFPLTFGARGSAMIGGALSTNAGGSNVVRYGSTRGLCLGLEVVLADGRVMDLMSELHKDNSGYDLKDLFIGGEGTLGIITAAVLRLFPKPRAYATAMVATADLPAALTLLNQLQIATGGLVEAFEHMPRNYVERHLKKFPDARAPFAEMYDHNIMVEVAATAPRVADAAEDGSVPLVDQLEETLAALMEDGLILDAVVAQSEGQRAEMWKRREDAAEVSLNEYPLVSCDISLPLNRISDFFDQIRQRLSANDPEATDNSVSHLGDGNLHYSVFPSSDDRELLRAITESIESLAIELGGSFSAEHGIGLSKKSAMARFKNPVAVDIMRAVKSALDPKNILNPGKVLPD